MNPDSFKSDPGIALALGSAFLGVYAHGGFLCGLNAANIFPGHVSGSSAGAIAAGFYATGFRGKVLEKAVLSPALKGSYPDPGMIFRGAPMFFTGRLTGLMNGKRTVRHLESELGCKRIEDAKHAKLSIAVTDLSRKEAAFLTSGSLAPAIMASCSVPILFTAQTVDGTDYHDGGILHELPFEIFVNDPAIHTIIVHSVSNPDGLKKSLRVSNAFSNCYDILNADLAKRRQEQAEKNGKRVIIVETMHSHPGLFQSAAKKKRYFDEGFRTATSLAGKIST